MKISKTNKQILWTFLSLPVGILGILFISKLLGFFVGAYDLGAFSWAIVSCLFFTIWWVSATLIDIFRFRQNKQFAIKSLLIFLVYLIVAVIFFHYCFGLVV
jgi:hypothetical protein